MSVFSEIKYQIQNNSSFLTMSKLEQSFILDIIKDTGDIGLVDSLVFSQVPLEHLIKSRNKKPVFYCDTSFLFDHLVASYSEINNAFSYYNDPGVLIEQHLRKSSKEVLGLEKHFKEKIPSVITITSDPLGLVSLKRFILEKKITPLCVVCTLHGFNEIKELKDDFSKLKVPMIYTRGSFGNLDLASSVLKNISKLINKV